MASATKKAGFNNQTIQQPRLQQPAKPDSTTKTPDSTTTIFNNQGFNNQKSRIQKPRVGWGGWGVDSITVSILLVIETMVLESVPTMVVESGALVVESELLEAR